MGRPRGHGPWSPTLGVPPFSCPDLDRSLGEPAAGRIRRRVGLESGEKCIEPAVALIPPGLVFGEPLCGITERGGLEMAEPGRRPAGSRNQAGALEDLEVARD